MIYIYIYIYSMMGVFMLPIMVKSNELFSPLGSSSLVIPLILSLSVVICIYNVIYFITFSCYMYI